MLKRILGICPYEVIDEEDIILMPEAQENIRAPTKEPTKESTKESSEETSEERTKESTKESSKEPTKKPTKESSEEPIISDEKSMEIKNTTDRYDKNTFNKILSIVDSNKFNHRSEIIGFKLLRINKLIDNIKNNTIDEITAKERINELKEIKKTEIKNKRLISTQKELINFFNDLLDTILTNNNNNDDSNNNDYSNNNDSNNNNSNDDENVNENVNENENNNNNDNDNDDDNDDDNYDDEDENGYSGDDKYKIRQLHNHHYKKIDETKSFKDQKEVLKELAFLDEYSHIDYCNDKALNIKILKLKIAHLAKDLDEKLFEEIFS